MDLDASLCFCEDILLRKYNICESTEILDDEDEENILRNEIQVLLSQKTITNADKNESKNDDGMKIFNESMIGRENMITETNVDEEIKNKELKIKQINRKGFIKCLEMMQNRLNISDESMAALTLLSDYVKPVTLREGDVVMHTTQGSPVHLDADGLYFIQVGSAV